MSNNRIFRIAETLFYKEISIIPLVIFRIVFGLVILVSTIRFASYGWITQMYINPKFHFTYYGFEWIKPLGNIGMYVVFIAMGLSAIGVALGAFYRISATMFFLSFTYVELIDKTTYLNHYYFVSLVSFLLILVPAAASFSIDSIIFRKKSANTVPAWCINIFKLQLGVVYFYAGLSKLIPEWIFEAFPLRIWLPAKADLPVIGFLFNKLWVAYIFSWFGAVYDLSIPFLLLCRKTRSWAYITVVVFHIVTWLLFPIGMFPWVMIFSTLIFFSTEWHSRILNQLAHLLRIPKKERLDVITNEKLPANNYWLSAFLFIYLSWQLLFPFRFMLYPGKLFWTEQGYRFSWRVMLMEKTGTAFFHIKDRVTGREIDVNNREFLSFNQEKMMTTQPDMILEYAHYLHDEFEKRGIPNPIVRAEIYVTLNGNGSKPYIDPNTDLSQIKETWKNKDWVLKNE